MQNGALALSGAALTIATGGLAGELLGFGSLESTLGAFGLGATSGAASTVTSGSAAAPIVAKVVETECSDPTIESAEIPASDLIKELNRLAAGGGDPRSASQVLGDFFKANGVASGATSLPANITLTPGISTDLLQTYRAVAEQAIAAGIDTRGVQAARIDLIDATLSQGLH